LKSLIHIVIGPSGGNFFFGRARKFSFPVPRLRGPPAHARLRALAHTLDPMPQVILMSARTPPMMRTPAHHSGARRVDRTRA
jgi:hypothetical protein